MKRIESAEYMVVVVTNQVGVVRGDYTEEEVKELHEYMNAELQIWSYMDEFYYCPHHPAI